MSQDQSKIIFIVGSTATGKSRLAIDLAKRYNGVIVNCDSVQFYKGLEIGSAAPDKNDLTAVPHYLYSYINPPQEMSAGEFIREFYKLIESQEFQKNHAEKPIFLVGGTGFYIQALEKGMYNIPQVDPILKQEIETFIISGHQVEAYEELKKFDPETPIHFNDLYRIGRALEIKRAFNLKMSELHLLSDNKYKLKNPFIKIGLEIQKDDLRVLVHQRSLKMIDSGLVDEVKKIIEAGYSSWAPLNSVGFFETKKFLENQILFEKLADEITQSTMKLIKKQKTWFKRDPEIKWFNLTEPHQLNEIYRLTESFLI